MLFQFPKLFTYRSQLILQILGCQQEVTTGNNLFFNLENIYYFQFHSFTPSLPVRHLVLSYLYILYYFLTMPLGLDFNLTVGLKPQVGGIKIVTVNKRSIFQVEWLIATLICY